MKQAPVALFDSGVGGISVLAEMMRLMPTESFIYFGDSAHAPYGSRSVDEVRALTEKHAEMLFSMGAKALVVACNTATGAAIEALREKYSDLPIIGMEPAIKPAAAEHSGGRILVMATPVTLASAKFRHLMDLHRDEAEIVPVPCARLARMVEQGILSGDVLDAYLAEVMQPFRDRAADAVVLGCTHYPFVREAIIQAAGTHAIYDGGAGTARETRRRLVECGALAAEGAQGSVQILNSLPGNEPIAFCRMLLSRMTEQIKGGTA